MHVMGIYTNDRFFSQRVILHAFNVGPLTFVLILLYNVIITKKKNTYILTVIF